MLSNISGREVEAAFGEGSAAGLAWVQGPLTALERGAVEEVVDCLAVLAQEREQGTPAVAQVARKAGAYFRQRREQVDYPRFVAAGYQIGSGLAESACKRFGTDRMCMSRDALDRAGCPRCG